MKRSVIFSFISILVVGFVISSCVKDQPDEPPASTIPFDPDKVLTVTQIRNFLVDSVTPYVFTEDYSVYLTVGMDESSGNIYRSSFTQDAMAGIQLNFLNPGGLYLDDSIRVNLNGSTLDTYPDGGLAQLQNLDVGKDILKIMTNQVIEPLVVTIPELVNNTDFYQSKVIQLNNVQFLSSELGKTYADAVNFQDQNVWLEDCDGNGIEIRTSGYANFAGELLPEGNGTLIAIASVYYDAQLVIRSDDEVMLDGERCGAGTGEPIDPVPSVSEDFESATNNQNINTPGWSNIVVAGDRFWQGKFFENDNNTYAQATGFNSGLDDMETWLITPPVINTNGDKILTFNSGMAFWTHTDTPPLVVLASTNFDGSNFDEATWTELSPTLANAGSGNYNWVQSGDVSLATFVGNVSIAFKHNGSDSESTSSTLDDVVINTGGGSGSTIFSENFDESWGGIEAVSVIGSQVWERENNYGPDGSPCARISGYEAGSFENDDWLVTSALDLSNYSSATLSFESAKNYDGDPMTVNISTNYSGNPATATWITLSASLSSGNWEWTPSGNVDLSDYVGQTVYVGFNYTSTNQVSATWEVDNVVIKAAE